MSGGTLVRIVCLGRPDRPKGPTPFDGQWLVEYDPTRDGVDANGAPLFAHLVTTPDRARARVFATAGEVTDCLWAASGRRAGPEGRPDRPIMAFTLATEPLHDDGPAA